MGSTQVGSKQVKDGGIQNQDLADMAQSTFKGRFRGAGTGAPQDLVPEDVRVTVDANAGYEGFAHDGSKYTCRKIANCVSNVNLGLFTMVEDRLIAIPMVVPNDTNGILEVLALEITTGSAGRYCMFHVYENDGNGYPGAELYYSGPIETDPVGYIEDFPSLQLKRGARIWIALEVERDGSIVRGVTSNSQSNALGKDATGTGSQGALYVDVGFSGGSVDPFPSSIDGTYVGTIPAIHTSWS